MNVSSTQFLAAILILLATVKLVFILVDPAAWIRNIRRIYAKPQVVGWVALGLAGLVLSLLLQSGLTITQILAVCLFLALLVMVGIAPHAPRILDWFGTQDLREVLRKQWLYVGVWLILMIWGLFDLF